MRLLKVVLVVLKPVIVDMLHLSVVLVSFRYMVFDQVSDQNFEVLTVLSLLSCE
jgi:hypothetical protein